MTEHSATPYRCTNCGLDIPKSAIPNYFSNMCNKNKHNLCVSCRDSGKCKLCDIIELQPHYNNEKHISIENQKYNPITIYINKII